MAKRKLAILVIEDSGMYVNIAEEMLKAHHVTSARTVQEGIDKYKKLQPDITFLDIALPDGSGHDVLIEIKKNNADAYVIMMTASRLKDDVLKSLEEGAEGYVIKPFSEDMIHECINEYYEHQSSMA